MKKFLLILWQLPQNFMGLIVKLVLRAKKVDGYYRWKWYSGVSLGKFIFVNARASEWIKKHEGGHQKQSLYLGWLYLIVIGLPSFIWCGLYRIPSIRRKYSYYWFYTEKWANKLAGIEEVK